MPNIKYSVEIDGKPSYSSNLSEEAMFYGVAREGSIRTHEEALDCVTIAMGMWEEDKDTNDIPLEHLGEFVGKHLAELMSMESNRERLDFFYRVYPTEVYGEGILATDDINLEDDYADNDMSDEEVVLVSDEIQDIDPDELELSYDVIEEPDGSISNIRDLYTLYRVNVEDVKEEYLLDLVEDEGYTVVSGNYIKNFENAEMIEFDEEGFNDFINALFDYNDFYGYIGFNHSSIDDTGEAYKLSMDLTDMLPDENDVVIDLIRVANTWCVEFRLNSANGSRSNKYTVIGIDDGEEYDYLLNTASFDDVKEYIEKTSEDTIEKQDVDFTEEDLTLEF